MPASEASYVSLRNRVASESLKSRLIWVDGSCLTRTLAVEQAVSYKTDIWAAEKSIRTLGAAGVQQRYLISQCLSRLVGCW